MNHEPGCRGTKVCSKCNRTLSVLAFSADRNHADGTRSDCRDCQRAYVAEHRKQHDRAPRALFRHPLLDI